MGTDLMTDDTVQVKKLTENCSDDQFLKSVYSLILQRDIDSIASSNYVKGLQEGYLREQVVIDLLNSSEYINGSVSWLCGSQVTDFLSENKRFWSKHDLLRPAPPLDAPCVFVSFCHPDPTFLVRNGIIANYLQLQKQQRLRVIPIILKNRYQVLCQKLADSFGFDECVLIDINLPDVSGFQDIFTGVPETSKELRTWLLSLKFNDITVGDAIYDNLLRDKRIGTIEALDDDLKRYCLLAYQLYNTYRELFDQHKDRVIATIQDHMVYINGGILARLALSNGITVYSNHGRSTPLILKKITTLAETTDFELKFSPESFKFVFDKLSTNELETGFNIVSDYYLKGENHHHTLLKSDKYRLYSRGDLLGHLQKDPCKPVVFIMSHLMCDAPHQQGRMLFDDYYQWLLQTLDIVKDISEVNWIVRQHPFDTRFTDSFTTQDALAQFQQYSHISACPEDLHPGSLIDSADALITVRGTVGLEAAVFGKPCVIAGSSPYSGHGIAIEPQTIEEYREALHNLCHPKPLSVTATILAKAYAYLFFKISRVSCSFLPPLPYVSLENIPDGEQWVFMTESLKTIAIENDPLYRNFMIQSNLNFPHLLDFENLFRINITAPDRKSDLNIDLESPQSDLEACTYTYENVDSARPDISDLQGGALPLISVITICRNSEKTIRRCIESVLAQTYPHFEYIIQDGVSTDRTLDIIKGYDDPRIKLVSEPDSGGSHAYFKALCRCSGDIITLCWSDEELLPHAIQWGVENMAQHPEVVGIYGDVYSTDIHGKIDENSQPAPAWDLGKFLCWEMMANYCASFMRYKALQDSGFFEFTSSFIDAGKCSLEDANCIMYDYFALPALIHPILHVPGYVGKFSVHKEQLSSTPKVIFGMIPGLLRSIDNICDSPLADKGIKAIKSRAYAGIHLAMINTLLVNAKSYEDAKMMLRSALQHEPDIAVLEKVCRESCDHLVNIEEFSHALEFLSIIEQSGYTFSDFGYFQALTYLESGLFDKAQESIKKGLLVYGDNSKIQALDIKLRDHMKMQQSLETELSELHQGPQKQFTSQLLYFTSLAEHKTLKRLGQILNGGISAQSFIDAASILEKSVRTPGFLISVRNNMPDACPLIEKTLTAYLCLAAENNASELAKSIAVVLSEYYTAPR